MNAKEKAIQAVMEFYDISRKDCVELYMGEVESYLRIMELSDESNQI